MIEGGNSKWLSKGEGGEKKNLLWNLHCSFPALPRMVGTCWFGQCGNESVNKGGDILFILKLEGFRNGFLWHQTQIHLSLLALLVLLLFHLRTN